MPDIKPRRLKSKYIACVSVCLLVQSHAGPSARGSQCSD